MQSEVFDSCAYELPATAITLIEAQHAHPEQLLPVGQWRMIDFAIMMEFNDIH